MSDAVCYDSGGEHYIGGSPRLAKILGGDGFVYDDLYDVDEDGWRPARLFRKGRIEDRRN